MTNYVHSPKPQRGTKCKTIEVEVTGWDIPTIIRRLSEAKDKLGDTPYRICSSEYGIDIDYNVPELDEEYRLRLKKWEDSEEQRRKSKLKAVSKRYEKYLELKKEFESESDNDIH